MKKGAREIALEVLNRVERGGQAGDLINGFLRDNPLSVEDRHLVTELTMGTIRRRNTLDWLLQERCGPRARKLPLIVRNILRMGIYQLIYLDRIPPYAVVDQAVRLSRRYRHGEMASLVNGVLREVSREKEIEFPSLKEDPISHISLKYSHPRWLVERWLKQFGPDETIDLCQADNEIPPQVVRTNTLKISRDELISRLIEEGLEAEATKIAPEGVSVGRGTAITETTAFGEGLFYIQDEGAMLASHLLAPQAGETVLDLCSAPGGKATHLAQLMGDKGRILAIDENEEKLSLLKENSQRLGLSIVEPVVGDVRNLENLFPGKADRILLDVRCSNLGVLRRRVEARWRQSEENILRLRAVQLDLLRSAAPLLKNGGSLLYSTCTLTPEENEEVVRKFLDENPEFVIDRSPPPFLQDLQTEEGFIHTYPHRQGTDGVFLAKMRKQRGHRM